MRFIVRADQELTTFVEVELAVKLDCGKDTDWLLFDPTELQRFAHQKGGIINKRRGKVPMTGLKPAMELIRSSYNYFATNQLS